MVTKLIAVTVVVLILAALVILYSAGLLGNAATP